MRTKLIALYVAGAAVATLVAANAAVRRDLDPPVGSSSGARVLSRARVLRGPPRRGAGRTAATSEGSSGSTDESKRATSRPSRSSRYFVKFQPGSSPAGPGRAAIAANRAFAFAPVTWLLAAMGKLTP